MKRFDKEQIVKEFADVINRYSLENLFSANVPDFILAEVAFSAIETFAKNYKKGCDWYGVHLEPAKSYLKKAYRREKDEGQQ